MHNSLITPDIAAFFRENNINDDTVSESQLHELIKASEEINTRINNLKKAKHDNQLNLSAIAQAIGIARKTVYNHTILAEFINYRINEETTAAAEIKKQKEEISKLNEEIKQLVIRDIKVENMLQDYNRVLEENKRLAENREAIIQENTQLRKETERLKERLVKVDTGKKIVNINIEKD